MLFLTSVDCTIWRISFWLVWALNAVLRLLHGLPFRKAFLKSDTAVTLRGRVSKVLCITLVFKSIFMMNISAYSCGTLQNHRMFLELLNITRQCLLRFFYINMHFIEHTCMDMCQISKKLYEKKHTMQ